MSPQSLLAASAVVERLHHPDQCCKRLAADVIS